MKRINLLPLLFCLGGLVCAAADNNTFTFSSDTTQAVLAKGKERTILSGKRCHIFRHTEIRADTIELYGEDFRYASCSGNVTARDEEKGIVLRCDTLFYDRDEEKMVVTGYGEMQDQKNEMMVKGGFFEDDGMENITVIEIGVRILKIADGKEMACRSDTRGMNGTRIFSYCPVCRRCSGRTIIIQHRE